MPKLTTIQLSIDTHRRLYRMKTDLEKITGKTISFEQVLRILLLTRPLEETISDLLLE
ncbi:MAG: hypothetical protein ACE5HG_01805 [Candidatus Bathyarchaeia archaeon]